jgi:hypothetical protein
MTHYDHEVFTHPMHEGWVLEYKLSRDDDADAPWERGGLLGEVRVVRANRYSYHNHAAGKRPGERVLDWTNSAGWAYDWRGAVATARKHGSTGPDAVRQANWEFDYLRRWLTGQWFYCDVAVRIISCPPQYKACLDDQDEYSYVIGGVESDATDSIKEAAKELGDDAIRVTKEQTAAAAMVEASKRACPHCGAVSNPVGWCHVGTLGYLPDGRAIRQESGALGPSINSGETE